MKRFEDLEFCDDFMFGQVMRDGSLCAKVMSVILNEEVEKIIYPEVQKSEKEFYATKGVRFDIFFKGAKTMSDIEIQVAPDMNILKRARYYLSMLDAASLGEGEEYETLKDSVVVFICLFDPLKKGRSFYTGIRSCVEDNDTCMYDGTKVIFLNVQSFMREANFELRALLEYIATKEARTPLTKEIDRRVIFLKSREEVKEMYANIDLFRHDAYRDGKADGLAQGLSQGLLQGLSQGRAESQAKIDQLKTQIDELKAMLYNDNGTC